MNTELLPYYERELLFVRKMASEFAERYPDRAAALKLTHNGCEDPHVERMIEAFALIAGRIQRKIDDEFPEITQALLDVLYPHFLRQVPSMAIAQFEVDAEQSRSATGHVVPRGALAYSEPVGGVQCRFRTAYPTRLFPLQVTSSFSRAADLAGGISSATAHHALRLDLTTRGAARFSMLQIHDLRFHIAGDPQVAHWIYELLFNNVSQILLRCQEKSGKWFSVPLEPNSIVEVGFGREEAVLPYAETSFQGYRLLQEYFCFPQKFLFFDLTGLERAASGPFSDRMEIVILFDDFQRAERANLLESAIGAETFRLGCTPVVNLFEHCAEPVRVSHTKTEYPIVPDVHAPLGMEVYSVNRVTSVAPYSEEPKEYRPFYSFRHGENVARGEAFWYASRRPSERNGDAGTDVYLSLVDCNFKASLPAAESITPFITCTNRNLPEKLPLSGAWGELDLESSAIVKTRIVSGPSRTIRPPQREGLQWRLISHLSLNHLSLVEGGGDALREILRLYDSAANPSGARQISGLTALRSTRKMARLDSEHGFVFCQGVAIDTEFDEDQFAGGGVFLMACILERFFGLYSAVNSFTQLRVSTRQRKGVVWAWPPRTGEQIVV